MKYPSNRRIFRVFPQKLRLLGEYFAIQEVPEGLRDFYNIEVGESIRRGSLRIRDVKLHYRYVGNVDEAMREAADSTEVQHDEAV